MLIVNGQFDTADVVLSDKVRDYRPLTDLPTFKTYMRVISGGDANGNGRCVGPTRRSKAKHGS
jgi:hypothetical protein